jgi:ligand-binding sensor protein
MEMQPKKKGKGCLIAIGVVFGIAILVGVLSNLGGGVKVTKDKDENKISVKNQAKEAEETYMNKLEENREAIMEKVFIEKDDVENVTRYYPKN